MGVAYKVAVGFAALVLIAVSALLGWVFLYTRDLPDIEHLADFAPDSGNQLTDTCLPGLNRQAVSRCTGKRGTCVVFSIRNCTLADVR
jgi:hypothetical protein